MDTKDLTKCNVGDIIKLTKDNKVTLGKVVDTTEDSVLIFRKPENIWYALSEYDIKVLESAYE